MREIKFRGKNLYEQIVRQKDGDDFTEIKEGCMWLYGGYAEIDGKGYIFPEAKCHQAQGDYWMDDDVPGIPIVDKETVGEYTGLKDRNGREIYEGDVVDLRPRYSQPHRIEYSCGQWICVDAGGGWVTLIENEQLGDEMNDVEVIGNIYDNPELLEQREQCELATERTQESEATERIF